MKAKYNRRAAFTLVELAVTTALLGVLLTVITQSMAAVERHMRRTDERTQFLRIVENLMEEVTLGEWDEIDEGRIKTLTLPEDARRRWPNAELTGEVVAETEPAAAKRVTLSLRRSPGPRERPVTLTAWVYQAPETR
jgi:prepilin-type N-terminal cleavage/methylation domain-containing protein